jgi:signal transduction histidine kinase
MDQSSVPEDRKQTDKSLGAERAKTDSSLLARKQRRERQADAAIQSKRDQADDTRDQKRLQADQASSRVEEAQGANNRGDRLEANKRLFKDRLTADEALDTERRHEDSILEKERLDRDVSEKNLLETERKKTDADLTKERTQTDEEAKRATVALTTRDEFLAIVSHDLRNPLGSISVAVDLLKTTPLYAQADDATCQFIDMIGRNTQEALRLISDLMDMESIAAGKLSVEREIHDIVEIIQHAVHSFQGQASTKKLSLELTVKEGPRTSVNCDCDRVSQVFSNLIGNALKFTPNGGKIALNVFPKGDEIKISIADTGPGISKEMQQTIFERFWQLGKPDRQGLGLGLYIAKMIVEAHQGRLWVESELGQGSVFHLTLPAAP